MLENNFVKLVRDIIKKQNANKIAEVDSIFLELEKRNQTLDFIAFVFSSEQSPYFLLKYYKHWNLFKYKDWLKLIKKLKNDRIGTIELILWMYNFFLVDIISLVLEEKNVAINVKDYIRSMLIHQGKWKIGVSRLMHFSLPDDQIVRFFGVSTRELRAYGMKLIEQGAVPRDIKKEIIFTGNKEAKVPFEIILEGVGEDLRRTFYNNPRFGDARLLNGILERADEELVEAFLDENPFIRELVARINDKWVK